MKVYNKSDIPEHLQRYFAPAELGLEETPEEYVANLVAVFREVRRVLRADGVVWLNLGDSYATQGGSRTYGSYDGETGRGPGVNGHRSPTSGLKPKDLMMIPARVALALQADGWWLRSQCIWHKPNAMPESVKDRPTNDYEVVYLLAKAERYFYDAEAVKEAADPQYASRYNYDFNVGQKESSGNGRPDGASNTPGAKNFSGFRNKRAVWSISTSSFKDAHFATFPPDLVEPMIKAGTSERGACPECGRQWERVVEKGDPQPTKDNPNPVLPYPAGSGHSNGTGATTLHMQREAVTVDWRPGCGCDAGEPVPAVVLDPFAGAGTALLVADRLGRDAIGIELNEEYARMAYRRIVGDAPLFTDTQLILNGASK